MILSVFSGVYCEPSAQGADKVDEVDEVELHRCGDALIGLCLRHQDRRWCRSPQQANQRPQNFDGVRTSQRPRKNNTNTFVTTRMSHITEHPLRTKRRKLDDDSHPVPEVNFTSPAQLRELLVFQQNPATAKQGQSIVASHT
jgi:hypothetical protein